jgi:hypothetical protein
VTAATISVDGVSTAQSVAKLVRQMDDVSAAAGGRTVLDFSLLSGSSERVSPRWGAVLAAVLAGRYRGMHFEVDLPENAAANTQMARAGLFCALAHHEGLNWSRFDEAQGRSLRRWAQDWEPAEPRAALFDFEGVEDVAAPAVLDDRLVAFVNADSYPRSEAEREQATVLHPWLRRLASTRGSRSDEAMLGNVSQIISALLENVRVHGGLSSANDLCSVSAFVTKGSSGGDLLYLSVLDTGVGMPATLAQRDFDADVPTDMRVAAAFNGTIPLRERDRGRGLHGITCLVNDFGGSLFAASGTMDGPTYVVDHHAGGDEDVHVDTDEGLGMTGTVVVVALPVLRRSRQDLRRDEYEAHR